MATVLVVRKSTGRIVFLRDEAAPLTLGALFPYVTHNYVKHSTERLPEGIWQTCWQFGFVEDTLKRMPTYLSDPKIIAEHELNVERADKLCLLARAVERDRHLLGDNLVGQDTVYAFKLKEAISLQKQEDKTTGTYPFLDMMADLEKITREEAASMILLKSSQEMFRLRNSEEQRLRFTKRILSAPDFETLDALRPELIRYLRHGN